jgi:predicted dinucleotide-binding enzyme
MSGYLCVTKNEEMATKKTIAIVGATEDAGKAIVNRFASMAYRLLLISQQAGELNKLTEKIARQHPTAEVESLECVKDGCWEADIIIIAVEGAEEQTVAELMKEVATQKIVVVVTQNENECKEMERLLPYSKIVKAFINLETNEIVLSGNCETVNEEIANIFIQAGYQPATKQVNSNF